MRRPSLQAMRSIVLVVILVSPAACGTAGSVSQPVRGSPASQAATGSSASHEPVHRASAPGTTDGAAPGPSTPGPATACTVEGMTGPNPTPADLLDPAGTWFGMGIDWGADSVAAVASRMGTSHTPAAWTQFVGFPIADADRANLDGFYRQVRSVGGIALLTLQPNGGLATVTIAAADALARMLAAYRACGVSTLLRFAHEMNGTWYPWGQDPVAYVAAFRTVAASVHRLAPGTAMLWAPNSADGYPFTGGRYAAAPGSAAFVALDTNHDGRLTAADDAYAPYWPGDDAVDWVGMSLYHWGNSYPWGANAVPPPGRFAGLLTGTSGVSSGSQVDFYATYAKGHHKPMAIAETAAFWRPGGGGASEQAIKQAWWRQVFSSEIAAAFPAIHLIGWFEWRKVETEVNAVVDWRLTARPDLVAQFLADLPPGRLRFALASGS
jgi:hypothetical protein